MKNAKIYSSSSNSNLDRFLRNMCAHAGFEHTSIKRMVIDIEKSIVKIVYNKDVLFKILRYRKIYRVERKEQTASTYQIDIDSTLVLSVHGSNRLL